MLPALSSQDLNIPPSVSSGSDSVCDLSFVIMASRLYCNYSSSTTYLSAFLCVYLFVTAIIRASPITGLLLCKLQSENTLLSPFPSHLSCLPCNLLPSLPKVFRNSPCPCFPVVGPDILVQAQSIWFFCDPEAMRSLELDLETGCSWLAVLILCCGAVYPCQHFGLLFWLGRSFPLVLLVETPGSKFSLFISSQLSKWETL